MTIKIGNKTINISHNTIIGGGGSNPVIRPISITPSTSQQNIVAPRGVDGYNPITVNPVTSKIDTHILPQNIKKGVNILGVEGVLGVNGITPTGTINITSSGTYDVTSYETANIDIKTGILEGIWDDIIAGNNPVDITELQSVEDSIIEIIEG